jgi:hypothetical protein
MIYYDTETTITRAGIFNVFIKVYFHRVIWIFICAMAILINFVVFFFVGYLLILHLYLYTITMTTLQYSKYRRRNQIIPIDLHGSNVESPAS